MRKYSEIAIDLFKHFMSAVMIIGVVIGEVFDSMWKALKRRFLK